VIGLRFGGVNAPILFSTPLNFKLLSFPSSCVLLRAGLTTYDKKSWTDTGTDKTYGTAVMSLLEPRKECLPSRLPRAARKSPRHTDESAQTLGPRSVSILNKMEPLPSLLYRMITRQRAKTNSYLSVLPISGPRARHCQTFSRLKWVPPSPIFPKPQIVAGPLST
jgi:hypothetical protein